MFSLNDVAFLGSLQPPVTDPNFAKVSLLLHGDGANGSTSIIDSSPSPKTLTAVGNAQISTAQSLYGGSSILFDGVGDRITTPSNSDFALGTGDFTIEAWVRETARTTYATLIEIGDHLTSGIIFLTNGGTNQNGRIGVYAGISPGFVGFQSSGSLNTWNHIAYVRASGQLTCFVNGTGGTAASFTFNHISTSTVTIGSRAGGAGGIYDFNGNIEELRVTKAARYLSNFTPPTAPFPDAFAAAIAFFLDPANIGLPVGGGYFGGLISHTADGNPTHALIVAPAATGATGTGYTLTTNLAWKTSDTATTGANSLFDGAANTAAMVAAGIANHPAAQFCANLTIGGFNDWYLPAQLEHDIVYFNLKPTTANNATGTGINAYAVPPRTANYTAGNPLRTAVAAFQAGGAEAFAAGIHWASNELTAANARRIGYSNGAVTSVSKATLNLVRAFRRIAL